MNTAAKQQHTQQIKEPGAIHNASQTLSIASTQIILENKGQNQGKIIIKCPKRSSNYEMYWGAMGGTIQEFILAINNDYFINKLLGSRSSQVFDVKGTFKELRKFIREELDLPYYKHPEFQQELRCRLNTFQSNCEESNSERYFVDCFVHNLVTMNEFYLIFDRLERERIEKEFKNISEPWGFIQTKESNEAKWLKSIHNGIKNKLKLQ